MQRKRRVYVLVNPEMDFRIDSQSSVKDDARENAGLLSRSR